jgi:hypothetical protein
VYAAIYAKAREALGLTAKGADAQGEE